MTSTETRPTLSERFNPRNWTLAWKLVIVCLIPALLALTLGILRVSDQASQAAELGRSSRLLEVAQQVSTAADTLRDERDASTLFAAGNRTDDRAQLEDRFRQSDAEIDQAIAAVNSIGELEVTTHSALQKAERELATLADLRTDAAQNPAVDFDQISSRYTAVIDSVDILGRALLRQLSTPGIGGLPDALTAVMNITEQLAIQHTELGAAIRTRTLRPADAEAATAADSQLTAAAREYSSALTLGVVGNPLDETANTQRHNLEATILDTAPNKPVTVTAAAWDAAYLDAKAAADRASTRIRKALTTSSAAAEERASNEAGLNSVILMLGLLIGATIAVLVARNLLRSLQVLRTTALDVAERRLPQAVEGMRAGETPDVEVDPVPLSGRDEVAQVARAFDAVHGQAVRLAAEQAALQSNVSAMFVNLSRRSQALVERQLQLIEQLESNEQDADQLSNLFQLDHLATRMRRNSENLLVLAGTDLAKRNIAPIPMVDVLRAAVSEVEQYQRIVVQAPPSVTVVGRAASDLVHLLAELLDNATSFSPPDSQVVMSTARTSDGSIVVEIADRGVGMVEHELSDANQRLSGPSGVDVSASRRMGLFVVGRLGARHGITVRLSTSSAGGPGAGLTASVTVPGYLIPSANEPAEMPRPIPAMPNRTSTLTAQRPGTNGAARTGSLSALVAGTDGPANPAGVFDAPAGQDGQLFAPQPPPMNGSIGKLPTRRPGQSVRPDGPNSPPKNNNNHHHSNNNRPDPAEQAAADQAKAEQQQQQLQRARELAAKAATDAAKLAEQQQQRREQRNQQSGFQNTGSYRNGVQPDAARSLWTSNGNASGFTPSEPPSTNGNSPSDTTQNARPDDASTRQQATASGEQKPTGAPGSDQQPGSGQDRPSDQSPSAPPTGSFPADTMFGSEVQPQRSTPTQVPPSPPTMPMPVLDRGNTTPPSRPATARPEQQSSPRPFPQGPGQRPQQLGQPAQSTQAGQDQSGQGQLGQNQSSQGQLGQGQSSSDQSAQPGTQAQAPQAAQAAAGQPPTEASRGSDGLFAPSVPVIAEPAPAEAGSAKAEEFDLSETTPIFEEIASAWFRSNRPIPVNWQEQAGGPQRRMPQRGFRPPAPAQAPTPPPTAATPAQAPVPAPAPTPAPPQAPTPPPPAPTPAPAPAPAPAPGPAAAPPLPVRQTREKAATPKPAAPASASASASDQEFASAADEGWRAASSVAAEQADEITAAGLPKRRPRARLVPGSAGSAVLAPPVSSSRSAETVRGRLASYQHGVRQGRESRLRGGGRADLGSETNGGTKPTNAGVNHDEESS